jgi:hypothetical protein
LDREHEDVFLEVARVRAVVARWRQTVDFSSLEAFLFEVPGGVVVLKTLLYDFGSGAL